MATVTNTSKNTVNKNIIVPEVYAGLVDQKIKGKVVIAQSAIKIGTLMGQVGETINFPSWVFNLEAKDIKVGTPIPTTALKQDNRQATIKMIAPDGVAVNDYDDAVAFGNALQKAVDFQATAIARKIDADLIADAYKTPLKFALGTDGAVTFDEMNGVLALYGDDANATDFSFIAIHSAYIPSFLKMDGFVSAELTHTANGNGVLMNNQLGYFRGIPVVVTDRLYDSKTQEKFILAVKKDSLAIVPKETVHVEVARDASTRTSTVYTSQYIATCRVDDSGIVLAKKTLPSA